MGQVPADPDGLAADPDGPGVCSYARHIFEDGKFTIEVVDAEALWDIGLRLRNLPGPEQAIEWV